MMTRSKLPPPPPPSNGATQAKQAASTAQFAIVGGRKQGAQRVLLYGPGGVGKTSLASLAPNPVFLDIGDSTQELDVARVEGIKTFADLRACVQSGVCDQHQTIILDDWTTAEEYIKAHVLGYITNDRKQKVGNIEEFGFGKGYQHVYDQTLLLMQDLERHTAAGRHVIIISHDCTANVPHPFGEDFIRFEPFMQTQRSGKASIRERMIQWSFHVLFVGYDVASNKGKGIGGGTRTIYTDEMPTHRAKSRSVHEVMPFESADDGRIWDLILNNGGK